LKKLEKIYEGKTKALYTTEDPDLLIQVFKDEATAGNAEKRGTIPGKGPINNQISARLFELLGKKKIATHFVRLLAPNEMLVRRLKIVPIEVVVRNLIAGSTAKRLGIEEGRLVDRPVVELYLKDDRLGDPLINDDLALALRLASEPEIRKLRKLALRVNRHLAPFLKKRKLTLVDFKLEFGRHDGEILLGDEISPDTCRLWDLATREKMDKDRFRRDLGGAEEAYREVFRRVCEGDKAAAPAERAAGGEAKPAGPGTD
jgi:phosphoribosylaminoimidazole-succinocarboxamide synthase